MRDREARFPRDVLPEQGGVRVVEIGTHRIGLYRVGDSVYALADRCPHRGAPLCAGAVATPIGVESGELTVGQPDSVVRCPWHKWEFEIATGRCTVDERLRVRQYSVELDGDDVVVCLDVRADEAQHDLDPASSRSEGVTALGTVSIDLPGERLG